MKIKFKTYIKDFAITLLIFVLAFVFSLLLQDVLDISEHITTLFVFACFLVSLMTNGYVFGFVATVVSVLIINYAFTYPFFNMDFTVPESIFSAGVMLIISLLTSTLTTKLKKWQVIKVEFEKENMRANLLRAVSHDVRTPLTTIYGASSSIIENYEKLNDSQKMQMIAGIKEDSEWLIRMVENLLSITRFGSGKVDLVKTPTVLEELIDSVVLKFKKRYSACEIDIDIPEDLFIIPMDAILIEQVILNILENVIHHAIGFNKIILRVKVIDNKAIFEIIDDGCGIENEKLEGIFKGFIDKKESSCDTKKRNAGIGLSFCATIIKAHGGNISAENIKEGGAKFSFSLDFENGDINE